MIVWSKPKIVAAVPQHVPSSLQALHLFSKRAGEAAGMSSTGNHDTYRPHVTIGRKVLPEHVAAPLFSPSVTTDVTHLHVFESVSGPKGVNYLSRFAFALPSGLSEREKLRRGMQL
jgi:2'-5' RNA ligase